MEIRAARRSERDEVLDLLALWFDGREFFARYNQNDPKFRDELCLVARDAGRIVSTVQIFDRAVTLAGQRVPMGGIGSVFTHEQYRHKGVASELMRLAVETMAREGFEVSLLFAERLTFYNQFGWREIMRKFTVLTGLETLRAPAGFEIDSFDPARDLAGAAALHRSYSGPIEVTAVRDQDDWRGNLIYAGNQDQEPGRGSIEHFVIARERGALRAYARASRFHGISMIIEYGYAADGAGALLALFKYLGELAAGRPTAVRLPSGDSTAAVLAPPPGAPPSEMLVTHTAHDPALERGLAEAGATVRYHDDNLYMWRVLAADKLARRFAATPEQAQRRAFEIFADRRSLYWTADRF
jgi:predicted N-acetyltransferase YhbS